jgi:hypothetical protein
MQICDIYFTSMHFNQQNWLDDPDTFLKQVYDNLNEINGFHFVSVSLNMAQVYNVSLRQTNYDSMVMFLKGVKYFGVEFFDLNSVIKLEVAIRKQLGYIEGLYFENMEIRSSSSYSDINLGIFSLPPAVSRPVIIGQQVN